MRRQDGQDAHGLNPSTSKILEIRAGNRLAFEQLLGRWEPVIKSKARRFFSPTRDVEDFQQVGRMALHRSVLTFAADTAAFCTYATASIHNAMLDEQRGRREEPWSVEAEVKAEDEAVTYSDPLADREQTAAIDRWRGTLCERNRLVIDMHFYLDLTQAAIAERLCVTPARISQIVRDLRRSAQYYNLN